MKAAISSSRLSSRRFRFVILLLVSLLIGIATGCGSGNGNLTTKQKLTGNTNVTVVVSSAANDQLTEFGLELKTFSLTNQAGKTVSVISADQPFEAIRLNGGFEPITTISVPQDIYTSATATVGAASFTCVTLLGPDTNSPGSLDTSTYAYGYTPDNMVTVTVPSQITVTGDNMVLNLGLEVLQSATYQSCYPSGSYSITPTFDLTPMEVAAHPTNPANGKAIQFEGQVSTIATDGDAFTLSESDYYSPRIVTVRTDGNTEYQGIAGFGALQAGTFVDLDGALQSDGSLLATRMASYDTAALNVMTGPLLTVSSSGPDFYNYPLQQQGQNYSVQPFGLGVYSYADTTLFSVSSQLGNIVELPFVASFNSSNMVAGQNVSVYSGPITAFNGGQTTTATTITLMPQSIDGNVITSLASGSFTIYTVEVAPENLFPTLSAEPAQKNLLTNPNIVNVYVDNNTQKVNTTALSAGNTLRFYGLVFNDNGTLQMDCAQVSDGVPFSASTDSSVQSQAGEARSYFERRGGSLPQVIRTERRAH